MEYELSLGAEWVVNISLHSTWTDEDFIGRISRISRRTHVLSAARNTLQRALGLYRRQFGKFFDKSYVRKAEGRTWKKARKMICTLMCAWAEQQGKYIDLKPTKQNPESHMKNHPETTNHPGTNMEPLLFLQILLNINNSSSFFWFVGFFWIRVFYPNSSAFFS